MSSTNVQQPSEPAAPRPPRIRKVTDPITDEGTEQLMTAAVMYYEQSASQQEIANRLGVSRPTVSRLLNRAREIGIVRIEIVPPHVDPVAVDRLRDRLGLRGLHIASGRANEWDPGPLLTAPFGAALDATQLTSGDVVLSSWGRAVYSVSRTIRRSLPGIVIAPAMGGNASDRPWFQPNEIVRTWARAFGGRPVSLNAPALVSAALAEPLRSEPGIHEVVELWDSAKVALVGVGAWPKPDPSYAAAGFPVDDPALADAVGDVAGWSFTIDGEVVRHQGDRVLLGVTAAQLRAIPNVICFAGSASKALAAIGAVRAGLINVLVTDATTARAMDAYLDAEASA
jgi:DNA-binding transcriptional regulator LsrR (DeoR family)